jgi:hypothetical protein
MLQALLVLLLLDVLTCAATSSALLWTFSCHVKVRNSWVNC